MKKFLAIFAVIGFLLAVSTAAQAISFTVTPDDLADGPTFLNGQGGVPFGYDPDMPPPIGSFQPGPTGFGIGSFWSDVQGSAAGGPRDYTSFRMSPKDIFDLSDVTIDDIDYISYYTKNMDTNKIDWQLKIYTEATTEWYGYRFNFTRPNNLNNAWHLSSTDTNLKVNDIYDKVGGHGESVPGAGLLSDLFTDYGDEKILFIDIIAGYASNSPPVDSFLDGVEIALTQGNPINYVATMNLEPVPEPTTMLLFGSGLIGLAGFRRRFKKS